jgi:phosphoserine phosphatase
MSAYTHTEIEPGLLVKNSVSVKALGHYKLIAFDMDSTLINIECIDEIADAAGKKAEVAAITEASMRGELKDFRDSLMRRLGLLQGVPLTHLDTVFRERLRLNPGARTLVTACKAHGLQAVLVSGGFTYFADRVKDMLGLDMARANALEVVDGHLTGKLLMQSWGDICDGNTKRQTVLALCQQLGCDPSQMIAVGDGANDLPMMGVAGLSVAYHAKPAVRDQADVVINDGGLDRLLAALPHES